MASNNSRINQVPITIAQSTMAMINDARPTTNQTTRCVESSVGGGYGLGGYRQIQPVLHNPVTFRSRGRLAKPYVPWTAAGTLFKVPIHALSYKAHYGLDPPPNTEISHLCANAACFNPLHLIVENHQANMARIGCVGTIHSNYTCAHGAQVPIAVLVCQHQPSCMIITRR